jgi:hypothetical protein
MGAWEHLIPPIGLSNMEFPLESDLFFCKTSSPGVCYLPGPIFMNVEFPSIETILESMMMDIQPLPELEALEVFYQRIPFPKPSNGIFLESYWA